MFIFFCALNVSLFIKWDISRTADIHFLLDHVQRRLSIVYGKQAKGEISQFEARPRFRVRIKHLFRFLSLLFFFSSIVQFFASKKIVIKKTDKLFAVTACKIFWHNSKPGACPGVEPGTSRTRSENHATRPTGQTYGSCLDHCFNLLTSFCKPYLRPTKDFFPADDNLNHLIYLS